MLQEGKARAVGITLIHDISSEFYLTATSHVGDIRIMLLQSLLFFFMIQVVDSTLRIWDTLMLRKSRSSIRYFFIIHEDISQQLVTSIRKGGLTLLTIYKSWAKPGAADSTPKNATCGA